MLGLITSLKNTYILICREVFKITMVYYLSINFRYSIIPSAGLKYISIHIIL